MEPRWFEGPFEAGRFVTALFHHAGNNACGADAFDELKDEGQIFVLEFVYMIENNPWSPPIIIFHRMYQALT